MDKKIRLKLIISGVVSLGAITYIILQRSANKKLMAKIKDRIDLGINETGTGMDLGKEPYMSGQYYRDLITKYGFNEGKGTNIMLADVKLIDNKAVVLNKYLNSTDVPEEKIIELFKTFPSKAIVSFFAERYKLIYKRDLWNDLKAVDDNSLEDADRKMSWLASTLSFGVFGGRFSADELPIIKSHLDSLPAATQINGNIIK